MFPLVMSYLLYNNAGLIQDAKMYNHIGNKPLLALIVSNQ
jgi:hypothetical protein